MFDNLVIMLLTWYFIKWWELNKGQNKANVFLFFEDFKKKNRSKFPRLIAKRSLFAYSRLLKLLEINY